MALNPYKPRPSLGDDAGLMHPNGTVQLWQGRVFSKHWGQAESSPSSLTLYEGGFKHEMMLRTRRAYSEVAGIDVETILFAATVTFTFDDASQFEATLGNGPAAVSMVRRFRQEGCPLSERAQAFADASRPSASFRLLSWLASMVPSHRAARTTLLALGLACAGWLALEAWRFVGNGTAAGDAASEVAKP